MAKQATSKKAKSKSTKVTTNTSKLKQHSQHASGFMTFIREQGVVALASAFIIGVAAATLMKSLLANVVMPVVGILLGSAEGLKNLTISLGNYNGQEAVVSLGQFIFDVINFLVLLLVIYLVVHYMKLDRMDSTKD